MMLTSSSRPGSRRLPSSSQQLFALVAIVISTIVRNDVPTANCLEDGLAQTPPMGWRSWNAYGGEVNETIIRSVADALTKRTRLVDGVPMSLADVGYNRLGLDDGWQACKAGPNGAYHDAHGTPILNRSRFTNLRHLVEYGHNAGLLMDFYQINCICMDTYVLNKNKTWANLAWEGNAKQLLDADFDGVKIDNCGDDDGHGYERTLELLKENKRKKSLLVENSNQGHGHGPPRGLPTNDSDWCNMHIYRVGGDIRSNFDDNLNKLQRTIPFLDAVKPLSRPGCWAFPDMLECGNFFQDGGDQQLATTECKTHFFAWCIVSSPLMISFDVTNDDIVERIWPIIANREAIAINQEWAGHPGRLVLDKGEGQIWTKKLLDGQAAILFINRGTVPIDLSTDLKEIGLDPEVMYSVRDVGSKTNLDIASGTLSVLQLKEHDSWFVKLAPLPDDRTNSVATAIL